MKLDLLTNANVVDAAIRFINNEKNKNTSNNRNEKNQHQENKDKQDQWLQGRNGYISND
jgi:hypothetical protein